MKVFWSVLLERAVDGDAVGRLLDVAGVAALSRAKRISVGYQRTDDARNTASKIFCMSTSEDEDVLVMLDNDHMHPADIVPRLAKQCDAAHEVVAALAFRRSEPHDPLMFTHRNEVTGAWDVPVTFENRLQECIYAAPCAMAIRRSVFRRFDAAGFPYPYWRVIYDRVKLDRIPGEDIYFGETCEKVGIPHWVDTSFETPHITKKVIGREEWWEYLKWGEAHPDEVAKKHSALGFTMRKA